jgi:diadenosine tetraphosphate (Ap4A) HIT family hydrolase
MKDTITVTTVDTADLTTEFQRATCAAIKAAGETHTPVHLHIAARKQDDALVAVYVRMQGPKGDEVDDTDEKEETTN